MVLHSTVIIPLLFVSGILVGMFSAVVGGGALVVIPLFAFLGLPLTIAIATMRISAFVQQIVSVGAFWKEKSIEWRSAIWVGLFCMPGSYLGAHLVLHINERLLSIIVAVCMVALLVVTLTTNKKKLQRKTKPAKYRWLILAATGLGMGIYGGFYGAGFSTVLMLIFSLIGGLNLLTASGNSSVSALLMAIPATYIFVHAGVVDWSVFFPFTLGGIIGSWLGVENAAKFGLKWIEPLLIGIVCISVVKLVFFK